MDKLKFTKYLSIVIIFFVVSIANAGEFKKRTFSISFPSGWTEIPRNVIESQVKAAAKTSPDFPLQQYNYGFQLESSENWFDFPYILIQVKNIGRIPGKELEKFEQMPLQEDFDKHIEQVSSILSGIQTGKMVFDKRKRIVWMRGEGHVANIGSITGLTGMIPTEKGVIQVNGYSRKADYITYAPIFCSITESIAPAADLLYKPNWMDKVPTAIRVMNWNKVIGKTILWAVIGGIVALFFILKKPD